MNIHEYQAKNLLKEFGVHIPNGKVLNSIDELKSELHTFKAPCIVKGQIHAGGRKKAGAILVARDQNEIILHAESLFEKKIVSNQTGADGKVIHKLLVESFVNISKEYYLAFTIDRSLSKIVLILSAEGGTEIEELAQSKKEAIVHITFDLAPALPSYLFRRAESFLKIPSDDKERFKQLLNSAYRLFYEKESTLLEINPLVYTKEGDWVAVDAKVSFDESALFRHPEIEALIDPLEMTNAELEATKAGFSLVSLDGEIGCLVNGAGLAMATNDVINHVGGKAANFLDVGGSATSDAIEKAFSLILSDSKVKVVLVNIFGGIMKCDLIATGLVSAITKLKPKIPIVVRLEGTNRAPGMKILSDAKLNFIQASSLIDGAQKAVSLLSRIPKGTV